MARRTTARLRRLGTALVGGALLMGLLVPGASTAAPTEMGFQGETGRIEDVDARTGRVAPSAQQLDMVRAMGATARWNDFGTPHSLINHGGFLATGLSSNAASAARSWISDNRALFRLSGAGVDNLELLNDSKLEGTDAHVVLFRQRFGDLPAAQDGLLTVGVVGGKIAYASSSIAGDGNAPGSASLGPAEAYRIAAADVGLDFGGSDVEVVGTKHGWTMLRAGDISHRQLARLVALPTPENGVRPVFETIVLSNDHEHGHPTAFTHFIDAQNGKVWFRQNRVYHLAEPNVGEFSGTTGGPGDPCGPKHEFEAPIGTESIDVAATANNPIDDIVLKLYGPTGDVVASQDTGTSPEAIHYSPTILTPGTYAVEVCQFVPDADAFDYSGVFAATPIGTSGFPFPPKWRVFPANPPLDYSNNDTRELWCWDTNIDGTPVEGCDREVQNIAARQPWDFLTRTQTPSFTTHGNAAYSSESWLAANSVLFGALGPGPTGYKPVSLDRNYDFEWTNQWNEAKCDPSVFASAQRNDIDAATTNLFAMHNRMHDWSYFLGFTEQNFNLQDSNFGNTSSGPFPLGRELDPEVGNAQAGALSGGPPTFGGRDNANQITLNDGIPPITNMYLWQPIQAAFYAPCVDGDFDMSVIGHEYTHAISNRMVGGPDANLTGPQAGAMGESYSDFTAMEYLNEYGFVPVADENPYSVGAYVTGDKEAGIRNYGMDFSPLNYSDIGYDLTGPQVHADGEIWSAVNFDIRQALIAKFNAAFPESDRNLQTRCADGELPADQCPGNRRWMQIVFDAFLLMQPAVSMVDARDAYLAADMMRFGGANQEVLWQEFARGGLGEDAVSNTNADPNPKPSFKSPLANNGTLSFDVVAPDEGRAPVDAEIFVGDYEARATPISDTDDATELAAGAEFVPGTYNFVARADGYGARRFSVRVRPGDDRTVTVRMPTNWASMTTGANAFGDGVNHESLIDDTEETNWASLGEPVEGRTVKVDMARGAHRVARVQVSAMLRPSDPDNDADSGGQNRFSALRQFEILTCDATVENCSLDRNFHLIYTSPPDAFPAHAPRPRVPELIVRSFDVPDVQATHVALRVVTNQCTGGPDFQGDTDNDPTNNPDCVEGDAILIAPQAENVRAAELQVFSR